MGNEENAKLLKRKIIEMVENIENKQDLKMIYGVARAACEDTEKEKAED